MKSIKLKELLFKYQDGPAEHPNGYLLVKITGQCSKRHFFTCEVVGPLKVGGNIKHGGPIPPAGTMLETHINKLELHWEEA